MLTSMAQGIDDFFRVLLVGLLLSVLSGCGGGTGGGDGPEAPPEPSGGPVWQGALVNQLEPGGLLSPNVKARKAADGSAHITYFTESETTAGRYDIHYVVWRKNDLDFLANNQHEIVTNTDNCRSLDLTLDQNDYSALTYQGGTIRECGSEQESDVMFSIKENSGWQQYTGATGEVERNPVFRDGLAGTYVSSVFDSQGDLHISYQFLYEGCDSMNFQYPDLCYVRKERTSLDEVNITEETIEGNQYDGPNIQNGVGHYCNLVLDSQEKPVVFYYAEDSDGTTGLRVARRLNDGTWEKDWIETGCEIGGVSAARNDQGVLGVAYYVKQCTDGRDDTHCLKYAQEQSSTWTIQMVDETTLCGQYPSLAFDSAGRPAIAYYEMQTYSGYDLENLKLAQFDGNSWREKETVALAGDIGRYNNLWFDSNDEPHICTYSNTDKAIYIFYRE